MFSFFSNLFGLNCTLAFPPPGNGDTPRNVGRWYRGWSCASRRIRFLLPPQTNCLKFLMRILKFELSFKKNRGKLLWSMRLHIFLGFSHLSFSGKSLQWQSDAIELLVWNRALIWTWSKLASFKILHCFCILFLRGKCNSLIYRNFIYRKFNKHQSGLLGFWLNNIH